MRSLNRLINWLKAQGLDRVFVKFFSSSIISALVGVFTGFFTYRYISPEMLGIWSLFTVYETYASFTRLGIINGLGRELPYTMGTGDDVEARKMASTALSYSLFSNILIPAFLVALIYGKTLDWGNELYIYSALVVLSRLLCSSYTSYLSVTFRTSDNFKKLTYVQNVLSVLKVGSILLVVYFGFLGLLLRELLLAITELVLLHINRPILVRPRFDFSTCMKLFKVGFPLFIVSYSISAVDTFPRLYIIEYGTVEQLGLFSPVLFTLAIAQILPTAISGYMYPKMSFEFGKTGNKKAIWNITLLSMGTSFVASIPLALGVYFLADYVELIFPKYVASIPYLKVTSIAFLFIGYKSSGLSFAVIKSWRMMLINVAIYFVISVAIISILNTLIADVLMIASVSIVITFFVMFIVSNYLSHRILK